MTTPAETDDVGRVLVDADACPVKEDILEIADRLGFATVYISNGGMRPSRFPGARIVTVATGADAADNWIAEEARPKDVVVTADILLAERVLARGARAVGSDGREFTQATIGEAVSFRAFKQHLRETGESKGYNRPYASADRSRFRQSLDRILRQVSSAA